MQGKQTTLNSLAGTQWVWVVDWQANATWTDTIKEVAPIIHPDVSKPCIVVVYNATSAARESVRRRLAEYMTDVRARYNQQCATARPHLVPSNETITSPNSALHCYIRLQTHPCLF